MIECGGAGRARIATDHLLSAGAEGQGRRYARASQADDQIGPCGQWRARLGGAGSHGSGQPRTLSWYTTNPIAANAAATIQKRRMILVSDQAWSSKWWWMGAIRNTRLRNT
jgi:hypothetical protein